MHSRESRRIVVVGHGMVGARFLDELARRASPDAFDVTVLGAEPHGPYNRLLLAEVIGGEVDVAGIALPDAPPGYAVHTGRAAVELDRARRVVRDDAGVEHPYDTVVLALGAAPRTAGLAEPGSPLPPGVFALRTVDDCRSIIRAAHGATKAVVIGGGLLGVEAGMALRARGIDVTLVHGGRHVLDRQLDPDSAAVASAKMADLGLEVITGRRPASVRFDSKGLARAVCLADGRELVAHLIVVAVGVAPRTGLARAAGLPVDVGVLVGADLRSPADDRVAAIGDCAQPPGGCTGLLAPGWDQARALAESLTGGSAQASARGSEVVRLKAPELDVVTLGRVPDDPEARVISLVDRQARRSLQVAIENDRIVGATLVGAGPIAADLTVAFERGDPVPDDPAWLLLPGAAALLAPVRDADDDVVCVCNKVSRGELVAACRAGAHTVAEAACATRATTGCGGCLRAVSALLARASADAGELTGAGVRP